MGKATNKAVNGQSRHASGRELIYPRRNTLLALESDVLWFAECCVKELEKVDPANEFVIEYHEAKRKLNKKLKELEQWNT